MPLRLAEVLADHWAEYARGHRKRLVTAHYRAVRAVLACRTRALGGHLYRCAHCKVDQYAYHSCNHRSCPECGGLDQQRWCATQEARLLPGVDYFMVTFTIPSELWPFCRRHPGEAYDLLLRECAAALQDLARSRLGGRLGFTAVLHTWGRQMQHHPHVHLIVPAVAFDEAKRELRFPKKTTRKFLLPKGPLAARLRNRFEMAVKARHPEFLAELPAVFSPRHKWVVDIRHVGHGKPALRYLARYVHKTALGKDRLAGYDADGKLLLRWQHSTTGKWDMARLIPEAFITRFLLHVLPKGFVRVRHFGWMSGAARRTRLLVRALLGEIGEPVPSLPESPPVCCPQCGLEMTRIARLDPLGHNRGPPES